MLNMTSVYQNMYKSHLPVLENKAYFNISRVGEIMNGMELSMRWPGSVTDVQLTHTILTAK